MPSLHGNPAAGLLLLIGGIVGFLALLSGNLDRWLQRATSSGGAVTQASVFGPYASNAAASAQSGLSGGVGSSSSSAANGNISLVPVNRGQPS